MMYVTCLPAVVSGLEVPRGRNSDLGLAVNPTNGTLMRSPARP